MKLFFQQQAVSLALCLVGALIIIGCGMSFYNKKVMIKALADIKMSEQVKSETDKIFKNIHYMDISSRGYAIMHEESYLFHSPEQATETNKRNFKVLGEIMAAQGYEDPKNFQAVQRWLDDYVSMFTEMVKLLRENKYDEYKALLKQDIGSKGAGAFNEFEKKLLTFEEKVYQQAKVDYEQAMFQFTFILVLLLVFGLPVLVFAIYKLKSENSKREDLLLNLEENNQQFLFNSGEKSASAIEAVILQNSIHNLQKAAEFVTQISEGNYHVHWEALNQQNEALNKDNLVGRLLGMRDQMMRVKQEDEKRMWANEGLTGFSELIRKTQQNLQDLTYHSLVFLVKYVKAQQGSFFLYKEDDGEEPFLELSACYAFDRKKFVEKRIGIGQGLVGQTYLEAQTVHLHDIPQNYTRITSGLGDATPSCLIIVPLLCNNKVEALLEIASFVQYESFQIAFLEKAGEIMASAIAAARNTEKTKILLQQFQVQTEQLRAQEEEMRQNMEELEATQEEMRRKELEMERELIEKKVKV
jgi:CHASE3 domain sensor protein